MKKLILFIAVLLCSQILFAQAPAQVGVQGNMPKDAKVTGTIIDGSTNQPVPYASIAVYRAKDSTLVTGVMSNDDGSFTIQGLPYGKFYVMVTSVGYKKQKVNDVLFTPNQKIAALGSVKVNLTATTRSEEHTSE